MKKLRILLLITVVLAVMLFTCSCMDANTLNSFMSMFGMGTAQHVCQDLNGDTKCDTCQAYVAPKACTSHVDNDNDGVCDNTGCTAEVLMIMEDIEFNDMTKLYSGNNYTIKVENAPDDADIDYSMKNTQKNVGVYEITATVTAPGYEDCELTATLTINPITLDFAWGDNSKDFPSSGEIPELNYAFDTEGKIKEGDEVNVIFDFSDDSFTKEGIVTVTAKLDNKNYVISKKSSVTTEIKVGPNVRTVSFDTGVEGQDLSSELVVGGEPVDAPTRVFVKKGYEFAGWYNGDVLWNFDDPVNDDMTLTARWNLVNYNITYFLDGGTNSAQNPDTFTVENYVTLSAPTKDGCVFLGWFTDATFETSARILGANTADVNLYAKWSDAEYVELEDDLTLDSSNTKVTLSETAVNGTFVYSFAADLSEFGDDSAIYIGRGRNTVDGSYVKITSSKIFVYTNKADTTEEQSRVHMRAIVGYLVVEVRVSNGKASVIFRTGDGDNSLHGFDWSGRNGEIFFEAENLTLENATFGWYTSAYDELTWIIGDSNIGSPADTAYTNQLVKEKYGNFLTIGAEGVDSSAALATFKAACEIKAPKYAIWSFMTDDAENYNDNLTEFVSFCKENGITPILTTQPTAVSDKNEERNAAVKATGERYIDFADIALCDGVIDSNNNVTYRGAVAFYSQFMADFPEIVAAEATMRTEKTDTLVGVSADLMYPENYVASDDVSYNGDGSIKLKYGEFEQFRKDSKETVLASAIKMNGNAIKDGKYMIISAKIDGTLTEDQTIIFGHGYMASTGKWVEINGKYCWGATYQSWGTAHINPTSRKEAHGLTIKNYITVVISCDTSHSRKITIFTDGGNATIGTEVNGNAGDIFMTCAGVNLTDVTMSWTCSDYAKDVWVFGDSYLSVGDPARWPTHLRNDGFYTSLLVGASGMSTQEGLANLEDAIQYGKPKYIVWLEGMNNGEKNGAPNSGYHNSMKRVFEICEENDIVLYVATIPNCPAASHSIKNSAIYNGTGEFEGKDYRIIDWARAVEDLNHETLWYEGMINTNDLIHPALAGAKALYMQLAVDAPEIMGGVDATFYKESADSLASGGTLTVDIPEEMEYNKIFTFRADYDGDFDGTLSIGNGKGVEGGTWAEIDENYIVVYQTVNGEKTEIARHENLIIMKNLINLRVHVKGDTATISFMSVGETGEVAENRLFHFETSWTSVGDAYVSVQGETLTKASLAWHTFEN